MVPHAGARGGRHPSTRSGSLRGRSKPAVSRITPTCLCDLDDIVTAPTYGARTTVPECVRPRRRIVPTRGPLSRVVRHAGAPLDEDWSE